MVNVEDSLKPIDLRIARQQTLGRLKEVATPTGELHLELDWNILDDDMTRYFSDSAQRERVRRLLIHARNESSRFCAKSRRELSELKLSILNPSPSVETNTEVVDSNKRVNDQYKKGWD